MDTHGDIQDRDEVEPEYYRKVKIVEEALEKRGGIHVYYPNHRDQDGEADDIHLDKDRTYVWSLKRDGKGLIFTQDGDEQYWLFPEEILYVEAHNEA